MVKFKKKTTITLKEKYMTESHYCNLTAKGKNAASPQFVRRAHYFKTTKNNTHNCKKLCETKARKRIFV